MTRIRIYLLVLFFAGVFFILPQQVSANSIVISNVKLQGRNPIANTATVEFDITWDNSWRDATNFDAVWVFLKVRKNSGTWYHGMLANQGVNPIGTSPGTDTGLDVYVSGDKVGAFIQRDSGHTGTGTITSTKVQLLMDYGAAPLSASDNDTIQVKVFGIEMVYIPSGNFYIGDGNGSAESQYAFHRTDESATQVTSALGTPVGVDAGGDDDAQITASGIGIDGDDGLDTNNDATIDNPNFPTGYRAFYLMKYELSQAQYRDFLNTLDRSQQNNRVALQSEGAYVMANDWWVDYRQTIKAGADPGSGPFTYGSDFDEDGTLDEVADGEWIAMNYLSWMDLAAYADWAGLRPMTELEFEKAARGTASAVYDENVWGTTDLTSVGVDWNLENSGTSSEGAATTGAGLCADTIGTGGPYRTGFAATFLTSRTGAGAGYYGNMELGGNMWERVVTLGNSTGRAFLGTHGDGVLNTGWTYEGNATNSDWPGWTSSSAGVSGSTGSGFRGGSYDPGITISGDYPRTSRRTYAATESAVRSPEFGGRLARTANIYSQTKSANTFSQVASGDTQWTNLSYAQYSDDMYTTVTFPDMNVHYTYYLQAEEFNFNIPSTAKILGIEVTVEGKASPSGYFAENVVKVLKNGTETSENKSTGSSWGTDETFYAYGGEGQGWGDTWTPTDINDPDFGVELKFYNSYYTVIGYVDQITMTVFYSYE